MSYMFHPENILKLLSWIITLASYIYALFKWRQFKSHFLIRNRFPVISYLFFYIIFIAQTVSLTEALLYDLQISNHSISCSITYYLLSSTYTISGLILYRINLIYSKWKSLQPTLITNALQSSDAQQNRNSLLSSNHNVTQILHTKIQAIQPIYRSTLSIITLLFIIVGSVVLYISHKIYWILIIEFAVLSLLITASILNIKHKKVQDIGCVLECYTILISLIVQIVLQIAFPFSYIAHDTMRVMQTCIFFVFTFQGIATLYIPLLLIFKAEGTLNVNIYRNKIKGKIFTSNPLETNGHNDTHSVTKLEMVPNDSCPKTILINKSLFDFLYRNEMNHGIFSDYLRYCFALENLLFVERVSIFYQFVFKLQKKYELARLNLKSPAVYHRPSEELLRAASTLSGSLDISQLSLPQASETMSIESARSQVTPIPLVFNFDRSSILESNKVEPNKLHRLEFIYLTDIYEHYGHMINTAFDKNEQDEYDPVKYDIVNCKEALYDICQEIYDQFLSCFSSSQINISYEAQEPLERMLSGTRADGLDTFKTYTEFLVLFDEALIETYCLMINVYGFQFKKYVKKRYPHVCFEGLPM